MILRRVWIGACAALCLALAAGSADAYPIVFNGAGGYGISAASAEGAEADGVQIVEVEAYEIESAAALGLTIPAPDVLSAALVGNPSVSNPNRVTSEWSVTNAGPGALSDAWLVFLTSTDYPDSQVGFEIDGDDGWIVISVFVPSGEEDGDYYFYPARYLGDLGTSDLTDFQMRHLIGVPLVDNGTELVLPQYGVGALSGIPLPEPHALALVALGLGVAVFVRRARA
jgi:hypothetical protein